MPAVTGFDEANVLIADAAPITPQVVIAATGYTRDLEQLVGHLGVLDHRGQPTIHASQTHPAAPNLYFTGFTTPISGMLRELNIDARKIAKALSTK